MSSLPARSSARPTPVRRALVGGGLAVAVALGSAACGGSTPAAPAPSTDATAPAAPGATADPAAAGGLGQALTAAGGGAAGLAALGQLGRNQGLADQVKTLGSRMSDEGQALSQQLQQAATAAGITLTTQTPAELQTTITDLQARTGAQFDPAFLQAANQALQQLRDEADAIINSPDATPAAKAAAQDALTKLEALSTALNQAGTTAGAGTPTQVSAGSGGQFAQEQEWVPVAGGGLLALGVVMLGGSAWRRRAGR